MITVADLFCGAGGSGLGASVVPGVQLRYALIGWDRLEIPTHTGQSARGDRSARTEVLWSNRPIADQDGLFGLDGTA